MHVPYRGAAPAINDLLGQQVQMTFLDLPVLLPQIKAGTLRPIALGAPERAPTATGGADHRRSRHARHDHRELVRHGGARPARRRRSSLNLHKITTEAMADPTVKEKLAAQGATLVGDTPEHFRGFIDSEIKKWAKVIKDAGVVTTK